MHVVSLDHSPVHCLEYLASCPSKRVENRRLPILSGQADGVPAAFEAVVCTADLQGIVVNESDERMLLGEALARELATLSATGRLPAPNRVLVFLCGDFYARPGLDRQAGNGDVRPVWKALAASGSTVVGVAGNHDLFGASPADRALFKRTRGLHLLDADGIVVGGLRVAGIGGVVGNPRRPARRSLECFVQELRSLLEGAPDVLLLHEGPPLDVEKDHPHAGILQALLEGRPLLTCYGHRHPQDPVRTLPNGTQLLNVAERVVILRACSRVERRVPHAP